MIPSGSLSAKNRRIKVHQDNFHREQFTTVSKRCMQDTQIFISLETKTSKVELWNNAPNKTA
jgi:hypothetical protein